MKNRLSKVLAAAGVASRRRAEEIIFSGHVKVNGKQEKVPQTQVELGKDEIRVYGKLVEAKEPYQYFILNKPKGYHCSNKRYEQEHLVIDLFAHLKARFFTVGRLDKDSTGLILVTNDGHFANRVIHPSSNLTKEYIVRVDHEVTHRELVKISSGTRVQNCFVKPVRVEKVRSGVIRVVIKEGKKREVRVLMEHAGLGVHELKRVRIGGLRLDSLPMGGFRSLTQNERDQIFS